MNLFNDNSPDDSVLRDEFVTRAIHEAAFKVAFAIAGAGSLGGSVSISTLTAELEKSFSCSVRDIEDAPRRPGLPR